ncbi:hypothetical protein [Caldilinea sp.]|uniref:hypothetical protein n=1 Tax=Caldilinea sp. TaxID=2293560 RepID=UPI0021DC8043|nr:hypothetical protein [Caldilinea sp.]GIV68252.1 MAG: hypothetical protein KatS3mg048_1114 [Caldilinea sp.]
MSIEIDLAPNHKIGLIVDSPLLLSPTAAGFGELPLRSVDVARLGAVVVGPVSAGGRSYGGPVQLVEVDGGVLVTKSSFSRSAARAVARFASAWERLQRPVIVQLVDAAPVDLVRAARRVAQALSVVGVEWAPPTMLSGKQVCDGVRALTRNVELPVWIKPPLECAAEWSRNAVEAGAVGVVVGQPLPGAVMESDPVTGKMTPLLGDLYGPLTFAPMLRAVVEVVKLDLGCAVIACGGVYNERHVQQALAAGARAVQLDALLWTEPNVLFSAPAPAPVQ